MGAQGFRPVLRKAAPIRGEDKTGLFAPKGAGVCGTGRKPCASALDNPR